MAFIEDTPETMVRTDLWGTMSLGELTRQQDLMIQKISAIQSLMGANASPLVLAMYSALQKGFDDLNKMIEARAIKERTQ